MPINIPFLFLLRGLSLEALAFKWGAPHIGSRWWDMRGRGIGCVPVYRFTDSGSG